MRETKQKQIGERGHIYHVTQFGARHGGRVLVRLLKMAGGAIGEALQGADDLDMSVAGKVIANLADTVSEGDYDYLIDTFAKVSAVEIEGKPVPLHNEGVLDVHFAGAYVELGQWLAFAIEVNFGNFFDAAGIVKAKAASGRPASASVAQAEASPSISQNT